MYRNIWINMYLECVLGIPKRIHLFSTINTKADNIQPKEKGLLIIFFSSLLLIKNKETVF